MQSARDTPTFGYKMKVLSYWNTTHECEYCGKNSAGKGAALVIKDKEERIICSSCLWGLASTFDRFLGRIRQQGADRALIESEKAVA